MLTVFCNFNRRSEVQWRCGMGRNDRASLNPHREIGSDQPSRTARILLPTIGPGIDVCTCLEHSGTANLSNERRVESEPGSLIFPFNSGWLSSSRPIVTAPSALNGFRMGLRVEGDSGSEKRL